MRQLYPIVSFAPKAQGGGEADPGERLLGLLAALERHSQTAETPIHLPLTWVLPGATLCDRGAQHSREIRSRLEAREESVGVLGLVGSVDQWLSTEEIGKSLEWSMSNTWATGVEDAKADVSFVVRAGADVERAEVRALYEANELPVLLRAEHRGRPYLATSSAGEALALLSLAGEKPFAKNELSARIKERLKQEPVRRDALILWIECPGDASAAVAMLEEVQRETTRRGTTAARFSPAGAFATIEHALASPSILQPPTSQLAAIADLRSRRGSMIATRRVLEAAAGSFEQEPDDGTSDDLGGFAWAERSVTATMAGRAALTEEGLYALLEGGRFAGIYPDVTDRGLFAPARALVLPVTRGTPTTPRKRTQLIDEEVHSCVSFESEISRGARSTLMIDQETIQALIYNEYSIVTDHPALVTTQSLVANSAGEYVLLTEGIPIVGNEVRIAGRYRDGSGFERVAEPTPTLETRWAEAFEISIGERTLSLVCLDNEARVIPWSLSWLSEPEPRLYLGTQMMLRGGRIATSFTFVLVPVGIDGSLVEKALVGNLPHEITDEIAAGRAATRRSLQVQMEG